MSSATKNHRTLNTEEAAAYCNLSSGYLRKCRGAGAVLTESPPFLRIGRRVMYLKDDLDKWLEYKRDLTTNREVSR